MFAEYKYLFDIFYEQLSERIEFLYMDKVDIIESHVLIVLRINDFLGLRVSFEEDCVENFKTKYYFPILEALKILQLFLW